MAGFNYQCQLCKKDFSRPQRLNAKFCSNSCKAKTTNNALGHKVSPKTRKILSKITKRQLKVNGHPFAGKKHTDEAREKIRRGRNNGKWRLSEAGRAKISKTHTGKNNVNWKGGITSDDRKERIRFRQQLQSKIFKRDNYTCQICDSYGQSIQVDHIMGWAEHPELRFCEDNCRTVCMACHYYVTFKKKLPRGRVWGHNLGRRITS